MAAPHGFQFGAEQWQCHGAMRCFLYENAEDLRRFWTKM
jgi:hypothetical protein